MRLNIATCVAYGCFLLIWAEAARAADPTEKGASPIEEIIVTARKREESIQNVPVAVTSITGDQLTMNGAIDLRGIALSTPGLVIEQNPRSGMAATISMRGQTTTDAVLTVDSPIGIYVDDVYRARNQGLILQLFDIEQVQVLRGVQGTLFGKNNTGGAVLISTGDPVNRFEVKLQARAGNYNLERYRGILNVPVVDDIFAVRAGLSVVERQGYLDDPITGQHPNSRDSVAWRVKMGLTPNERIESTLRFSGAVADQLPNNGIPNDPGFGFDPPTGFYESLGEADIQDELESQDASWNTTVDFGSFEAKTVLAYHRQRIDTLSESDGYPTPLLAVQLRENQEQYTAELQFTGELNSSRISWLAGTFFFTEDGVSNSVIPFLGRASLIGGENDSISVFGHMGLVVSDSIEIDGGVRYTDESRAMSSTLLVNGTCAIIPSVLNPGTCVADAEADYSYWSWDASISYFLSDAVHAYFRTGEGHKAGGFNEIHGPATLEPYGPETVQEYELGMKADWRAYRLRTNVAAYYSDYQGIQRSRVVVGLAGPIVRIDNAAAATIWGVEAQATWTPTDAFTVRSSFAYTNAEYDEFVLNDVDVSGNELPRVPEYTYSIGATYTHLIPGVGDLLFHSIWSYRSNTEFAIINADDLRQPSYGILNARVSLAFHGKPGIEVAIFGTNLADEKYSVAAVELPFGYDVLYRGAPLMWGGEISLTF